MRDYDPTTGRYIQADPLGLVDGASVYGYARQNPGRYVDPRGENPAIGLGVAIGAGVRWGVQQLGRLAATVAAAGAANQVLESARDDGKASDSPKVQKARERKAYSSYCKTPPPRTGDLCQDLKAQLLHARQCLQMREDFGRKWHGDNDHAIENNNWRKRIRNLEGEIRLICPDQCGPLGLE